MKKVFTVIILAALAVTFTLAGCKQKAEEGPKKYQIAVIPKGTTHIFWKSIHAGALKAPLGGTGSRPSFRPASLDHAEAQEGCS